jgi:hypothetical protein
LSQFSADFAQDLVAARIPFGRLLDVHRVSRVVQARWANLLSPFACAAAAFIQHIQLIIFSCSISKTTFARFLQ